MFLLLEIIIYLFYFFSVFFNSLKITLIPTNITKITNVMTSACKKSPFIDLKKEMLDNFALNASLQVIATTSNKERVIC